MHLKMLIFFWNCQMQPTLQRLTYSFLCEIDTMNGFLASSSFEYVLSSASYSRKNPCSIARKRMGDWKSRKLQAWETDHLHNYSLWQGDGRLSLSTLVTNRTLFSSKLRITFGWDWTRTDGLAAVRYKVSLVLALWELDTQQLYRYSQVKSGFELVIGTRNESQPRSPGLPVDFNDVDTGSSEGGSKVLYIILLDPKCSHESL
jgi:hypothetical protein